MITIKDIIMMIYEADYCKDKIDCIECSKIKYCGVNTKLIGLTYLYRGYYYG